MRYELETEEILLIQRFLNASIGATIMVVKAPLMNECLKAEL